MAAIYVNNIIINAGCSFSQSYDLESIATNSTFDLTGYTVYAQMRKWYGSSTAVDFSTFTNPSIPGSIIISLTSEQTRDLKPGRYVYDVIISDSFSIKNRIIEGMVLVREGVTR